MSTSGCFSVDGHLLEIAIRLHPYQRRDGSPEEFGKVLCEQPPFVTVLLSSPLIFESLVERHLLAWCSFQRVGAGLFSRDSAELQRRQRPARVADDAALVRTAQGRAHPVRLQRDAPQRDGGGAAAGAAVRSRALHHLLRHVQTLATASCLFSLCLFFLCDMYF